jgi:zinc/manganese transport system substrate-binding protein
MTQKSIFKIVLFATTLLSAGSYSSAKVNVVAALPDLGSIAAFIGGPEASVSSIANASSNPHSVEVFPSYMAKTAKADLFLKCGLGLDQWSDAIIDGSRNNKLVVVDCSEGIDALEKPVGKVDASLGDVHPFGNPHYWLNPDNGIIIAQNILAGLQKADPSNSATYAANFNRFKSEIETKFEAWKTEMQPLAGKKMLSYHSSWAYFASAFNLTISGYIEPYPGIPPTGKHLALLINRIKQEQISFIIQEPYFPDDSPVFLTRETGIPVVKLPAACKGVSADDYFTHFDDCVSSILNACRR